MTGEQTDGQFFEFDVVGRARGFLCQAHVHARQSERLEVIEGALRVNHRVLAAGEAIEVPPGAPHTQNPVGPGTGRVRITHRPAGRTGAFLERLAELDVNRLGYPRPRAAAEFLRDFGDEGHAVRPPLRVQRALAQAILSEYAFVDEWDVAAPPEAVWDTLADPRSYPRWWRPVYLEVEADDGPPEVGRVARHHIKGRLPYHLHTRTRSTRLERPRLLEAETDGDLRGTGRWTLTPLAGGTRTHVRFDWRVRADRRLLRVLSPVLRPALRWNHAWAIARARDGLEPYVLSERLRAPA